MNYAFPIQMMVWPHFGRFHVGLTLDNPYEVEDCVTFVFLPGSPYPERMDRESPCGGMCPMVDPHCHFDPSMWEWRRDGRDGGMWIAPEPATPTQMKPHAWLKRLSN